MRFFSHYHSTVFINSSVLFWEYILKRKKNIFKIFSHGQNILFANVLFVEEFKNYNKCVCFLLYQTFDLLRFSLDFNFTFEFFRPY